MPVKGKNLIGKRYSMRKCDAIEMRTGMHLIGLLCIDSNSSILELELLLVCRVDDAICESCLTIIFSFCLLFH